jgi:hypothetical protein
VNLQSCTYCGTRPAEKLTQTTWAWLRADRTRVAWRQKLCVACFVTNVLPLEQPLEAGTRLTCPGCHIDTEDDFDAVYVTSYVPGTGKFAIQAPLCGACAVEVRNRAQKNAERLEDRQPGSGAAAPESTPTQVDAWTALGITSRE